jgi:hypothetical protein
MSQRRFSVLIHARASIAGPTGVKAVDKINETLELNWTLRLPSPSNLGESKNGAANALNAELDFVW